VKYQEYDVFSIEIFITITYVRSRLRIYGCFAVVGARQALRASDHLRVRPEASIETANGHFEGSIELSGNINTGNVSMRHRAQRSKGLGLFRLSRVFFTICAAIVVLASTVAGLAIWSARQHAFREHQRDATNLAVVLAEQTARYIETIDMSILEVKLWATEADRRTVDTFKSRMQSDEVHQRLIERQVGDLEAGAIVVVGADGEVLNTSQPSFAPGLNVLDRDYYQYLMRYNDPAIVVGAPGYGHITGYPSLFFARRVNSSNGTFLGLIVSVVDAGYLGNFYRSISERLEGAVGLISRQGALLLRYPELPNVVGQKIPQTSGWYSRVAEGGGLYRSPDIANGVASIVVAQPLQEYPLVVNVTVPESVILTAWYSNATYIAFGALIVALGFLIVTWIIARLFRRQQYQNDSIKQAAADLFESEQKLRTFAEMSSDWFWEKDADLRFVRDSNIWLTSLPTDVGKTRRDLADPAMSAHRWESHQADLAARRPFRDFRWERIGVDGTRAYMSTSGDPIFSAVGTFRGYQGTSHDITADVEAAEELRLAKELAGVSNPPSPQAVPA
jgi:PAS domain-containing protein